MQKRGQFYLVTIMIVVSIFIGFISITNSVRAKQNDPFFDIEDELKIERRNILDHITYSNLNAAQTETLFENFSNMYLSEFGEDKNSLFIYGTNSKINLEGNRVENTNFSYSCGGGTIIEIVNKGSFTETCASGGENVTIYLEDQEYFFKIYEGQNLYYLVSYTYNKEEFTFYG